MGADGFLGNPEYGCDLQPIDFAALARAFGGAGAADARIDHLKVCACTVPTESPESDGTLEWDKTTIVIVEAFGGDQCGLGFTYADGAAAHLIAGTLQHAVNGRDAMGVPARGLRRARHPPGQQASSCRS